MSALKSTVQTYLNKFSTTTKLIKEPIVDDTKMIIVIPSYKEGELEQTLLSLAQCDQPQFPYEIIVVLNSAEGDVETEKFHERQLIELNTRLPKFVFRTSSFILSQNLPPKHAGVGLARKIGMDEAVRRFSEIEFDGMIVCLDADCTVSKNYLRELEKIATHPEYYNTVCLHYEHDLEEEKNADLLEGIINYESFLRYYKEALMFSGFPYPYHTVGSSMAVKISIYCKAGGMNKRKAGEDFYFLHKCFPYGKTIELNSCIVYPSCRTSERVPFGTGRSQLNFLKERKEETYNFQTFKNLKILFESDLSENSIHNFPAPLKIFLEENDLNGKLREIKANTTSAEQFRKRFFVWFDGFMVLRFVHEMRDKYYPNEKISEGIAHLLKEKDEVMKNTLLECLHYLRNEQKG
jgi:hypothetical protein